jgi:hypothetical protein
MANNWCAPTSLKPTEGTREGAGSGRETAGDGRSARSDFVFLQGTHEAGIGFDARALAAHERVGGVEGHPVLANEVGDNDGWGARDTL